ncbi:LytR C-terminal domain-containing protein [Streptomyces sp. DSM 3412]|uniref:LytR C-terminal domain-containing protein n=1 Tax=Streptomyces gottesmaniae TaxID=3075518 RepID=A0ABU2Z9N1_9ACTN|nr:LCP family protein [Streptomyces sp. DSM 3412]MDT0573308.1 LytR C-terminal domain-containing protein [Streptomyces sp. DSM 3412]
MNDRYDAGYGGGEQSYELVGYDEYGQPVYRQAPTQQVPQQQAYDPYGTQPSQGQHQGYGQGYGYDPYGTGQDQQHPQGYGTGYDTGYDTGRQAPGQGYDPYDPYGQTAVTGLQAPVTEQTAYIPQQSAPPTTAGESGPPADDVSPEGDSGEREYRTEQFAFVEEPDGDSEDVIDWLNFTENRTERREEAKRRAKSRMVALVVVLALVAVGGVGYLWWAGMLPGASSDERTGTTTSAAAQKRDVIVVHLHDTKGGGTSTALLVNNATTERGATVLIPNALALTGDDGTTTTLAKSVDDDGSSGTRDALDTVLGTDIEGTWRLDTPYLNNLVGLVGNIDVDTNTDVPDPEAEKGAAPLVTKGKAQTLSGKMAVAYATYRASGESQDAQLKRFGQVMRGVLRKLSADAQAATVTVQTLAQILDPSLSDKDLGTFLAKLADHAKGGDYTTELLPVQQDGTLSAEDSDSVVKDLLGGAAKSPDAGDAVRVGIRNATGEKDATEQARVVVLNGGYTFLDAGTTATAQATSRVTYSDAARKQDAIEVAKTLGLPTSAVKKGETTSNADVSVVLGQNYETTEPTGTTGTTGATGTTGTTGATGTAG